MKEKLNNEKLGKVFSVKGLYTFLVLLVLTIALITKFISDNNVGKLNIEDDYSSYSFSMPVITDGADVNDNVTGVRDTRPQVTAGTTAPSTTVKAEEKTTLFKAVLPYDGEFTLPLGDKVSAAYSASVPVYNSTLKDWRVHNAVDFTGVKGDRVASIAAGKVTSVTQDTLYGTVVVIDHGNGLIARYCGLAEEGCAESGNILKAGETIGYLDNVPCESADATVHLHFETTVNGKSENPLAVMGIEE